jgi:hypothetical protein
LQRGPACAAAGQPAPTRWTVARIGAAFAWLADYSLSGLWKLRRGWGLRLRAARVQASSPDPDDQPDRAHLCAVWRQASLAPDDHVVVFVDQMGYGRWPQAATDWMAEAREAVRLAERFGSNERKWPLMGALNAQTGQIDTLDNSIVGRKQVIQLFQRLDAISPQVSRIWVVLDNWSIDRHDEVQEALAALARLSLVWLPTSAPWLTPIEKFWRWLRQDALSLQRDAADWNALQDPIHGLLAQFATGSPEVLQ